MKAPQKVSETLRKVSKKFRSAGILADIVEQVGLFNGRIEYVEQDGGANCGEFVLSPVPAGTRPSCSAVDGWAWPSFTCVSFEIQVWNCMVGFGLHDCILTFDVAGDILDIIPDDRPSSRCWGTDDRTARTAQIRALVEA